MFNRKFSSSIRLKRRMIRSTVILLVVCLGIGYSAFTTNLGINGTLNVSKYDHTLYGVIEKAVSREHAFEYTKNHHDSFTVEPTRRVYYWRGNFTNILSEVRNEINVIFADHCWQMIRTTDTGGVKIVYNGEPENNQCLNTRGNHVGYSSRTTQSMSTTYYYGTSYTYDSANGVFGLDGTITTGAIKQGQYTCRSTSSTGTCGTLYLVDVLNTGSNYYVLQLKNNSPYSQFGVMQFNYKTNYYQASAQSYVGYMYNTEYFSGDVSQTYSVVGASSDLDTSNYYSDSIDSTESNFISK